MRGYEHIIFFSLLPSALKKSLSGCMLTTSLSSDSQFWGAFCVTVFEDAALGSGSGALQVFVPAFPSSLLADPFLSPLSVTLLEPSNLQQERRWERGKVTNYLCSPFSCLATDRAWLMVGKDPRIHCGSPLCDRGEQEFCTQCTADEI